MNTLIVIGYMSGKIAYLNITLDEAKNRYRKSNSLPENENIDELISSFTFNDEFCVYDAYSFDGN